MPTRAEFVELVKSSLVRDDISDTLMASWLRKAAKRINEEMRVGEMLKSVSQPLTSNVYNLPADFLKARAVRLGPNSGPLIFASPAALATMVSRGPSPGVAPGYYTVVGGQIRLSPWIVQGTAYTFDLDYFAKLPDLGTAADATNALTEQFEDLFLNAALIFGHRHYFEDDRALLKDGLVQQEIARLNLTFEEAKFGDGPLVMQPSRKMGGRFS